VPRPARSVGRTVDVLNFLGAQPSSYYSLTAIATSLGFNKATCHAMLSELVAQGMVSRGPNKTYVLGPALVNLGMAAALEESALLEMATRELRALQDELNVSGMITSLRDGDIEMLVRRDVQRPLLSFSPVGYRWPNRPPYGQEFMAWAPRAEVEKWLDLLPQDVWREQRPAYYRRLDDVRRTGYRATILEDAIALRQLIRQFADGMPGASELMKAVQERATGPFTIDDYQPELSAVTRFKAPIFDPSGAVVMVFTIGPFAPESGRDEIERAITRLLEGTQILTECLHGLEPVPDWVTGVTALTSTDLRAGVG
jgi:DNA-binding IclR family transcriptional regulator